jgi:hypothetical protein
MLNKAVVTFQGVAHPWLCDEMGHLNTRNYVGMFDDAMQHFMRTMGHNAAQARKSNIGWAELIIQVKCLLAPWCILSVMLKSLAINLFAINK